MTDLAVRYDDLAVATPRPRVELLAAGWLSGFANLNTRGAYARDLAQFAGWCADNQVALLEVIRPHIQLYARSLEARGRTPATVARKLSAIASFFHYCVLERAIAGSPAEHVARPKVSDESQQIGLDPSEVQRLLAAADDHGPVAHALVCLLVLNGLRVSEACNARVGDLARVRGRRIVHIVGKGGKKAVVPLAQRTTRAVDTLAAGRPAGEPLLRMSRFAAWRLVRRLAATAGLPPISPHSGRHTFVTQALDAGVDLRDVQAAARHADPRTTMRYDGARGQLDRHPTYRLSAYLNVDPPHDSPSCP